MQHGWAEVLRARRAYGPKASRALAAKFSGHNTRIGRILPAKIAARSASSLHAKKSQCFVLVDFLWIIAAEMIRQK